MAEARVLRGVQSVSTLFPRPREMKRLHTVALFGLFERSRDNCHGRGAHPKGFLSGDRARTSGAHRAARAGCVVELCVRRGTAWSNVGLTLLRTGLASSCRRRAT